MALPPVVLDPPFNILRISHIELNVTDLAASRKFYHEVLGLAVTDESDRRVYLRAMEERSHHCVVLVQSSAASVAAMGYRVWAEEDLDKAHAWFAEQGRDVAWVDRAHQGRTLRTSDNAGMPIELHYEMERLPSIHQEYAQYRGVKPLRIDHFNCFSTNVDEATAFYHKMGFRTTEYTADEETGALWASWLHRKGGVHDQAFTNGQGPRLHHVAFWVPHPLAILDLLDLMATTGYVTNIERGPGRHGISNAFFLYIRDPDNHRVEIYCSDYQTIDPDHEPLHWDLKDPQRQTLWGAPAPKSWFEEGSLFEGLETSEPSLKAQPIVAP
ncbi:MAG: 3,4-dihydroxyphenylacetate 2,3-dioxygenase [Rhizobiaceae bacterium]